MSEKNNTDKKTKKKKGFLRLGALLPFAIILAAIVIGIEFISGPVIGSIIKNYAQKQNGATVGVGTTKISLFGLFFGQRGLAVADKDNLSKDLFAFDNFKIDISGKPLFYGKVHAEKAAITGLRFSTKRATDGKLISDKKSAPSTPSSTPQQDSTAAALSDGPDDFKADSFLDKTKLRTIENADAFKSDIAAKTKEIDQMVSKVSDTSSIKSKVSTIKKLDVKDYKSAKGATQAKKDLKEISSLKWEIEQKQRDLNQIKSSASKQKALYTKNYRSLELGKNRELREILGSLGIDGEDGIKAASLLLGPDVGSKLEKYWKMYNSVEEYIPSFSSSPSEAKEETESVKGTTIDFTGDTKQPSFRINKTVIAGVWGKTGALNGTIDNISSSLEYSPIDFNLTGKEGGANLTSSGKIGSEKRNIVVDYTTTSPETLSLFDNSKLIEKINSGRVHVRATATSEKNQSGKLNVTIIGNNLRFDFKDKQSKTTKLLAEAINEAEMINITLSAKTAPGKGLGKIKMKSNIDTIVQNKLKSITAKKIAARKNAVTDEYNKRTASSLGEAKSKLNGFENSELKNKLSELDKYKSSLDSKEAEIKKAVSKNLPGSNSDTKKVIEDVKGKFGF